MTQAMQISASLEDYIEALYHIVAEKQAAKPGDLAEKLKVANSSVTGALKVLAEKALINYAPYDVITLTPAGKAYALDVVRRHEVLRDFFVNVFAVKYKEADEAACSMEHSVTKGILERFIQFAEFIEVCPRGGENWIAGFRQHCEKGADMDSCGRCVQAVAGSLQAGGNKGEGRAHAVKLSSVAPGKRCRVVKSSVAGSAGRRMLEMGVTPCALVEVERVAPLGDPIDIKVKGYHLSLRKEEADDITVELL